MQNHNSFFSSLIQCSHYESSSKLLSIDDEECKSHPNFYLNSNLEIESPTSAAAVIIVWWIREVKQFNNSIESKMSAT